MFTFRFACVRAHARAVGLLAQLVFRLLLRPRHYVTLRNVVLHTDAGEMQIGMVIVSTRGVFVVETWNAQAPGSKVSACASRSERHGRVLSCYGEPIHVSEEHARLVAQALNEDSCLVSPVVVISGLWSLPGPRPSHVVSEFGLVQYIRSFKADVYSMGRIGEIVAQISRPAARPLPTGA